MRSTGSVTRENAERVKLHVSTGDTVRVVRGDDKGKEGKVMRVYRKTGRVVVEGVNIVKKHRKARTAEEQSGIIEMAAPIHCVERDAARSEERRADADAPADRRRRHQGAHRGEEWGSIPRCPLATRI